MKGVKDSLDDKTDDEISKFKQNYFSPVKNNKIQNSNIIKKPYIHISIFFNLQQIDESLTSREIQLCLN